MGKLFFDAVQDRRTYYGIGKEAVVSDERIQEIVSTAVKYAPSAFNSQSARVVVLLNEQHETLWNIAKEELRKIVPPESFAQTEQKIDSFASGYASILYFEDMDVVEDLQRQFPLYKDNFPVWSQQSSGMLQYIIWTALETEGFGASLQHYNPLINEAVKTTWKVPAAWKLIAQMPFGKPTANPDDKQFQPLESRIIVYK